MKAGQLHESVAFDQPVSASDGMGGTEDGWAEAYTCRAHFRYLRGGESVQSARLTGQQPVVATIWACAAARAITPDWRMRDVREGGVYAIRSIVPSDDRAWLEVTAISGVAP